MQSLISAALFLALSPAQVAARPPQSLSVEPTASYEHAHSRLQLPPDLISVRRTRIVALENNGVDLAAEYASADQAEVYTIYIFRRVAADVGVWFDRARWMIEQRDVYGKSKALNRLTPFVPPGQASASGLAATYDLDGTTFKSTGVALLPLGGWIVKLRASSKTHRAAELEGRMSEILAGLIWPKELPMAPAATPVEDCTTKLMLRGKAKPVRNEGGDGLMGLLMGAVVANAPMKTEGPAPSWCRDRAQTIEGGVYRANESNDSYLIALHDSGRAVQAGRSVGAQVLAQIDPKAKGKSKPSFTVTALLLQQTLSSGAFDRLPPPEQALQILKRNQFATATTTWGSGGNDVRIDVKSVK